MSEENADYNKVLTLAEFEALHLPPRSMEQLAKLLDAEAKGTISPSEQARLEGVKEAAFYLQMHNRLVC